jgi:hypothetical protein
MDRSYEKYYNIYVPVVKKRSSSGGVLTALLPLWLQVDGILRQ